MNLWKFFRFLQDMPSAEIKLSRLDFQRLNSQTQRCLKDIHKDVTTHRQKIRRQLSKNILPRKISSQFREKVQQVLPKKLRLLEKFPSRENLRAIYGMLSGYLISMSGHRTGVLCNMLISEVEEAEVEDGITIIEAMESHKSAATYGHAQLCLSETEVGWFTTLHSLRSKFEGSEPPYFFFSKSGGKCLKLVEYFQQQWVELGFSGCYNFRNLRTSMVDYTKNISPAKRALVHRSMCHSDAVASKFYIPLNTVTEAARVRDMQETAAGTEERRMAEDRQQAGCSSTPPGQERPRLKRVIRFESSTEEEEDEPRSKMQLVVRSSTSDTDDDDAVPLSLSSPEECSP